MRYTVGMKRIRLETAPIIDKASFHHECASLFGFPDFYGRNMDAWIDCMSDLEEPDSSMTKINLGEDDILVLEITDTESFKQRCPRQFEDLVSCTAFLNTHRFENPRIHLVFL